MHLRGRQRRFLLGWIGLWAGIRATLVWTGLGATAGLAGGHRAAPPRPRFASTPPPAVGRLAMTTPKVAIAWLPPQAAPRHGSSPLPRPARPAAADPSPLPAETISRPVVPAAACEREGVDAAPLASVALAEPRAPSRWSASAYLFVRPGSGRASLAAGGELGGSQAAARIAYQLNRAGPVRTAVAARLYAPLAGKGAEAALGLDWHPLPEVPLRFSVERRADLDGHGRNAWSAYGAGGFYFERLGGRLALDGYGQAGVVGLARRDLFVDGALRAGRRVQAGPAVVTAGGGLWGAAQPGAARLDVGPRVAAVLPVAPHDVTLALEGRFRVAGHARPGSGAAVTLGFDL